MGQSDLRREKRGAGYFLSPETCPAGIRYYCGRGAAGTRFRCSGVISGGSAKDGCVIRGGRLDRQSGVMGGTWNFEIPKIICADWVVTRFFGL